MSILDTHEQLLLRSYLKWTHLCVADISLLFADEKKEVLKG